MANGYRDMLNQPAVKRLYDMAQGKDTDIAERVNATNKLAPHSLLLFYEAARKIALPGDALFERYFPGRATEFKNGQEAAERESALLVANAAKPVRTTRPKELTDRLPRGHAISTSPSHQEYRHERHKSQKPTYEGAVRFLTAEIDLLMFPRESLVGLEKVLGARLSSYTSNGDINVPVTAEIIHRQKLGMIMEATYIVDGHKLLVPLLGAIKRGSSDEQTQTAELYRILTTRILPMIREYLSGPSLPTEQIKVAVDSTPGKIYDFTVNPPVELSPLMFPRSIWSDEDIFADFTPKVSIRD